MNHKTNDKIINIDILNMLCKKYKFPEVVLVGEYVKIVSKNDTWYILNQHNEYHINLYHENKLSTAKFSKGYRKINKRYNKYGMHLQKEKFHTYKNVFDYISRHDKKHVLSETDNVFRINELLKQI
jgi:hypothetical protein